MCTVVVLMHMVRAVIDRLCCTCRRDMPEALSNIIQACWHQQSCDRPSAAALLASLEHVQASGVLQELDERRRQPGCMGLKRMH